LLKLEIYRNYPTISHGKGIFLYDTEGRDISMAEVAR
jgi:hypothetical protein